MSEREIPSSGYDSETKNKILDEATKLFALKGVNTVSMRDIAKVVGIKMSSIYYYYKSKDSLLEDILVRFENGYRHYFDWLRGENIKANSLEELMDNMFNKEFLEMRDPIGCLGMALALKEQHNNVSACKCVFELFFDHSISSMQKDFDRLVEKGIIPPSDTKTISMLFMFCVMVVNNIIIHKYIGNKTPVDHMELYSNLKQFITNILMQGTG